MPEELAARQTNRDARHHAKMPNNNGASVQRELHKTNKNISVKDISVRNMHVTAVPIDYPGLTADPGLRWGACNPGSGRREGGKEGGNAGGKVGGRETKEKTEPHPGGEGRKKAGG